MSNVDLIDKVNRLETRIDEVERKLQVFNIKSKISLNEDNKKIADKYNLKHEAIIQPQKSTSKPIEIVSQPLTSLTVPRKSSY